MTDRKPLAPAIANPSQAGVASVVRRDVTGLTRESACERGNLTEVDAHASSDPSPQDPPPPRRLAYATDCRYCRQPIYLALCSDGRWRSFDLATYPAAPTCVWAWRKHHGMQEQELVPGKRLHFCAAYSHFLATGATA